MDKFDNKTVQFMTALQDMYREEENRESCYFPQIELTEKNLTEDFTAMFYALFHTYVHVTKDDIDILDFVAICNRLAVQRVIERAEAKGE